MPAAVKNPYATLPDWLEGLLISASTSPVTTAISTAKLTEMLGQVLTPTQKVKGIPRVRLSSVDPQAKTATLHEPASYTPYDVSLSDLVKLLGEGHLVQEGPKETSVGTMVKTLQALLK